MLRRSLHAASAAAAKGGLAPRAASTLPCLVAAATSISTPQPRSSLAVAHRSPRSSSLAPFLSSRAIRTSAILSQAAAAAAEAQDPPASYGDESAEAVDDDDTEGSFLSLKSKLSSGLFKALTIKPFGYDRMSEVQRRVLHLIPDRGSEGERPKDLLVKAKTGTGKTIAFLAPAIQNRLRSIKEAEKGTWSKAFDEQIRAKRPEILDSGNHRKIARAFASNTTGALILSPTRELATQIATEAKKLISYYPDLDVQLLVGGASKFQQLRDWRKGRADVVVATPGRILDMLNSEPMVKDAIATAETVILDEADTLLEMGFRDDLRSILNFTPASTDRTTFLFSATVSKEIQSIAKQTLSRDHLFIDCVPEGEENTHMHIPQYATILPSAAEQMEHIVRLIAHDQLTNPGKSKIIVFAPTTRMTQLLSDVLKSRDIRSVLPVGNATQLYEIHSKKDQSARFRVSNSFRNDKSGASILVTSDVSARGVDYPGTTRVIQVGVPSSKDQYVHRIGRTGRAGKEGRGDIVLLPFEAGFIHSALEDLPVRTLGVDELKQEVEAKVEAFDQDPSSIIDAETLHAMGRPEQASQRRGGVTPRISGPRPFLPRLGERLNDAGVSQAVTNTIEALEPESIQETFSTLLGYYVGRGQDMRASKSAMLDGLKRWATEAGRMSQAPYLSPNFLNKLGYGASDNGGGRGGGGGGSYGRGRSGYGAPRKEFRDRYASPYGGGGGGARGGQRGGDRYGGRGSGYGGGGGGYGGRGGGYGGRGSGGGGSGYGGGRFGSGDRRDSARSPMDRTSGSAPVEEKW